jgi:hypothetical protein
MSKVLYQNPSDQTFLDEVQETICISELSPSLTDHSNHTDKANGSSSSDSLINDDIISDLREYVSLIAQMYHRKPFHNFQHACHVTMSVNKLMKRIVATDIDDGLEGDDSNDHRRSRAVKIAEQNSLDIAWKLLIDQLRHVMFGSQEVLLRFRQFVVNSVLATDIFDKELNDLRKKC